MGLVLFRTDSGTGFIQDNGTSFIPDRQWDWFLSGQIVGLVSFRSMGLVSFRTDSGTGHTQR